MTIQSAELYARLKVVEQGANDLALPAFSPVLEKILQFTGGTTANKFDLFWADVRTVTTTPDPLDLAGVLASAFGATLTMAEIVGVFIMLDAAATGNLHVGAGTNPWFGMFGATGDIIKVCPGGVFVNFAPDASGLGAVTAATADILNLVMSAGTGSVTIAIAARSA